MARGKLLVGLPCNNGGRIISKAPVKMGAGERQTADSVRVPQPLQGPNGVAYHLAISACAWLPGGQCLQNGVRLLRKMKLTHVASGSGDNADCKQDVMGYMTAIARCSKAREYAHALSLMACPKPFTGIEEHCLGGSLRG
jgi:hypothetical protein